MKASVIGLVLVGFLAAASAAGLLVMMRIGLFDGQEPQSAEVEVVVASADLAPMAAIRSESVKIEKVKRTEAPDGFISNPVQVIGRVLSVAVTAGQALTRKQFAADGTGIQFASALENGMRAVSLSLSDYSSLSGLLYPGCVVDVLAYLKPSYQGGGQSDPVSVTILKGVQVLGVEDQTIVSTEKDEDPKAPHGDRPANKRWMVTLLVKPKDAQALQLAMENGRITLAMRNPLDGSPSVNEPMTTLNEILKGSSTQRMAPWSFSEALAKALAPSPGLAAAVARSRADEKPAPAKARSWDVQVLRGMESQVVSFPVAPAK